MIRSHFGLDQNPFARDTLDLLPQQQVIFDTRDFILAELDHVALAHSTFTDEAYGLIVRSCEGVLRAARNLCVASLLEAVRDRSKTVDLKQINRVLLQPHWRLERDEE